MSRGKKVDLKYFKFFLIILFPFLIQISITYVFIQHQLFSQPANFLNNMLDRVANDIKYNNGKWDISLYNSDPLTPYPNSSSNFPVYVITNEGFVIERSKPINGLLDKSDFKQVSKFSIPQTLSTVTNENWRVYSQPIIDKTKNSIEGDVLVSYYNPQNEFIDSIDTKLKSNAEKVVSQLIIKDQLIDASKVDIRNTNYDVSFEIVDKYNKVIINNGRTPSFIDSSYVKDVLNYTSQRIISDNLTHEDFLINSKNIISNGNVVGIILIAQSLNDSNLILQIYLNSSSFIYLLITLPLTFLSLYVFRKELMLLLNGNSNKDKIEEKNTVLKVLPTLIIFNSKTSSLNIDDKSFDILPDTNQYYILKAMFSSPKKQWSNDELLDLLGEELTNKNSRKIYDVSLAINKKIDIKLIEYFGKTFSINKNFQSIIKKLS